MELLKPAILGLALALSAGLANAHVSVQPKTAPGGAYQVLRFGAGHGCQDRLATTAIRVTVPEAVTVARPQPKAGWRLETTKDAAGRVTAVTWSGGELAPDQFDEFVLLVKLPKTDGELVMPVAQTCGATTMNWSELPGVDGDHPAPSITLTPPADAHAHHH